MDSLISSGGIRERISEHPKGVCTHPLQIVSWSYPRLDPGGVGLDLHKQNIVIKCSGLKFVKTSLLKHSVF